jgi:hypothetical protein
MSKDLFSRPQRLALSFIDFIFTLNSKLIFFFKVELVKKYFSSSKKMFYFFPNEISQNCNKIPS